MKTPEEVKKALACCENADCKACPYDSIGITMVECLDALVGDAFGYIKQLEARVPKWISVKDRLPEDDENVMILSNERITFVGFYKNGQWISYSLYAIYGNVVTHWMPLPSTEGLK